MKIKNIVKKISSNPTIEIYENYKVKDFWEYKVKIRSHKEGRYNLILDKYIDKDTLAVLDLNEDIDKYHFDKDLNVLILIKEKGTLYTG